MKNSSTPFRIAAFAAAVTLLFAPAGLPQNNPIPGIDVVVRKQPGGSAIKATTDKEGRFVFAGLKEGTYVLSVSPPPAKNPNTGRSNHLQAAVASGDGVVKVMVAFGPGKGGEEPITVKVPKDGVKITGTVAACDTAEDVAKFLRIEGHVGRPQAAQDVEHTLGQIGSAR